jgi:hypothetical protein
MKPGRAAALALFGWMMPLIFSALIGAATWVAEQ